LYEGKEEIVKLLLNKGADANTQCGENGTALQVAIHSGNKNITLALLRKGANVNALGGRYGTALCAALSSYKGKEEIVKLLLDKGADANT